MNKKILILIVPFIILAVGGFLLWQQFSSGSGSSVTSTVQSMLSTGASPNVPVGELASGSIVPALSEKVMAVGSLNPRNIDPLGDHFAKVKAQFAQTAIWKKAGLDQILEQYLNQPLDQVGGPALGALESASPEAAMGAGMLASSISLTPAQVLALLTEEWSRIDEFVVALSAETFEVFPGTPSPKALLALTFKDDVSLERARKLTLEKLLGEQNSVTNNGVTIAKENSEGTRISIKSAAPGDPSLDPSAPPSGAPPGLEGSIEFEARKMLVAIGSSDYRSFIAASAGGAAAGAALKDTALWSDVRMSMLERPAFFGFYDAKQFLPYLETTMRSLDPTAQVATDGSLSDTTGSAAPESRPALSPPGMKDLETLGISLNVVNGVGARSCVTIARGSELGKVYEDAFASRAAGTDPTLLKLVDGKSLAAFNISGEFIKLYTAASRALRTGAASGQATRPAQDPEWEKFQKTYEALGRLLSKRAVRELGVIANAPRPEEVAMAMSPQGGAPAPDMGMVIEFAAPVALSDIAQMLNDAALLLAGDSGLIQLPVATIEDGTPGPDGQIVFANVIRIKLGGTTELLGGLVNENVLVIGRDQPALGGFKTRLASPTALVSEEALGSRGLGGKAATSDLYFVISTEPLIEMARGFIPMGLMMAPPDLQIGMPDVEEILKILTLRLFGVQNGFKAAEGLYCSEGHGVAL